MIDNTQESRYVVGYSRNEIIRVFIIGLVIGLLTWGMAWALNKGVFIPLMCKTHVASKCSESYAYALVASQVVVALLALFALVRQRVFRPLLVVLASTVTLWGLLHTVTDWTWYGTALASAVLYALAYVAFTLLARIRPLLLSAVAIVVLLVVARFVLSS